MQVKNPSVNPNDPAFKLDNQLCFSLYSASLAMTRIYKPLLDALALTYPQYLVLLVLWESDGLTVSALGERLSLDSGTLTPLIKRMQVAGWLTRQRSTTDERRVHVNLTPRGFELQGQAAHIPGCVLAHSGLSLTGLIALNQDIKALRSHMLAPETKPAPSNPI